MSALVFDRAFDTYDDGVASTAAWLVLLGKIPYKDFWTIYAPGTCFVDALLLRVYGESLLSIRMILPMLAAAQALLLFGITRHAVPGRIAEYGVFAGFLAFIPIGLCVTHPLTYWFTFLLVVVYALVRWIHEPKPVWEYVCGVSLGLSLLFRQDGGAYTAAALFVLFYAISHKVKVRRGRTLFRVYASFAAVIALVLVYFASHSALKDLYNDTIRFALFSFPGSREVPYPVPWVTSAYGARFAPPFVMEFAFKLFLYYLLPVTLFVFGLASLYRLWKIDCSRVEMALYAVAFLAPVLFLMVQVRPVPMRIAASVVLGLVVYAAYSLDRNSRLRHLSLAMLVLSVAVLVPSGILAVNMQREVYTNIIQVRGGTYAFEGYGDSVSLVSQYIMERTSPDEKILSGTPLIYFTAERQPVTGYFEPHPHVIDQHDIQRKTIQSMEREQVRYFVRSRKGRPDAYFATESEYEPRMVIDYINRNYRRVVDLGLLQVYERKTPFKE